ncbi:hypothetical protein BV133_2103 [Blastochloris viridis]|uniref:Uncharacterized protein n=1 Tax=Blastochloris viridis TaxID=1079 RepID=A0A182D2F0_BLAVI|nr:hypothetical protein BV133_2103 [Blastochloris viridis]
MRSIRRAIRDPMQKESLTRQTIPAQRRMLRLQMLRIQRRPG